jgi:hypothetical protein
MTTTTIATSTARADTTTGDVGDATTTTTTATVAGRRIKGVRGLSDGACETRRSPHILELQPKSLDMTGTLTPACGWKTISSCAMRAER